MNFLYFRLAVLAIALPLGCAHAANSSALPDPLGDVAPARPMPAAKSPVVSASATTRTAVAVPPPATVAIVTPAAAPTVALTANSNPIVPAPRAPAATTAHQSSVTPSPMQAPAALPHQAISAPSVATLRQLDALRSENAVLTEMVKAAELRSKLSPAQSGAQTSAPKPSPQVRPGDAARALQVVSVYGLDGELTAVIQLPGGGVVKTHAGTALPGIGRVTTVAHNEVVVTTVGGPVALPFAPVQVGEH